MITSERVGYMGASEQGAKATDRRWLTIPRTLCFVVNGEDVLLMKRGVHKRVFPNRYNGVGGHIERDEDPLSSAKREILEETGLVIHDIQLRAVYNIDAGAEIGIMLLVFTAVSDSRTVISNEEGALHWVPRSRLLELDLVDDVPVILPRLFEMKATDAPLFVHVSYDSGDQIVMRFAED
jgi:8-oxo-dGTP diphosphatase